MQMMLMERERGEGEGDRRKIHSLQTWKGNIYKDTIKFLAKKRSFPESVNLESEL